MKDKDAYNQLIEEVLSMIAEYTPDYSTLLYNPTKKLISKNLYKFVVGKKSTEFNSNIELIKLIIEHEACNEEYQRHFKINKLLK